MMYRSVHRTHERCQILVFVVLVVAFLFAWAMMFVHPSVTLLTFWLSLVFLAVMTFLLRRLAKSERMTARTALRDHTCPWCGAAIDHDAEVAGQWHCEKCGADFLDSGDTVTPGR